MFTNISNVLHQSLLYDFGSFVMHTSVMAAKHAGPEVLLALIAFIAFAGLVGLKMKA